MTTTKKAVTPNTYDRYYNLSNYPKDQRCNRLRLTIYYSKGGINYCTYKNEERGYYFSLTPEYATTHCGTECVMCVPMNGFKELVLPVNRQSKKQYEKAKSMMDKIIEGWVKPWVAEAGCDVDFTRYCQEERHCDR